ncbi:MAG: beta-galactosidase [Acidobacteriaceae bacterium]|nr:beta-galactosidase [Acidobacteriaceae bacterium]
MRVRIVACLLLMISFVCTQAQTTKTKHSFRVVGDHFELDGKPFEVIAGELHYARIPRQYWRQRLQMARAMGLNTVATYVFWNVHEPSPGVFDFKGQADLAAFIRLAQEEHLYVLLRAGPYSCAEWEFGGFPAWLLKDPAMSHALRANDPAFLVPTTRWLNRLGQEVAKYQIENGGPILATQVENEYGNFSNDKAYLKRIYEILVAAGFNRSLLYTVNPSKALVSGGLDGVYSGVNFGTGRAPAALTTLAEARPGQPLFATEYWPGWFDLWGHPHETRPLAPQIADLEYMLSHHASFNLYMFHGGTNFGMMAGASRSTGSYRGNVTSYDYDAPLDEAGHPTAKFFAYRDEILKHTGEKPLPLPAVPAVITIPPFEVRPIASLWEHLPAPIKSKLPLTMEEVGQSYGYILYRTELPHAVHAKMLVLDHLYDYAQVFVDGKLVGTLDRHYAQHSLSLTTTGASRLDILVENTGRLNSTRAMRDERKGLRGATLDGEPLTGWEIYPLPMNDPMTFASGKQEPAEMQAPHMSAGSFELQTVGDSFLDVRGLGKGVLWINGRALGRFWNIGPQGTLYLPGAWLHKGRNSVLVFELDEKHQTVSLSGLDKPILDAPTPGYADDPERRKKDDPTAEFGSKLAAPADAPKP